MKNYIAEFIGSFCLILVGVGTLAFLPSIIGASGNVASAVVGVGLAFGIIVMSLVYTIGPISGCHINPAVTIGVLAIKGMKVKDATVYIIAQIAGAIVAAAVLYAIFTDPAGSLGSAFAGTNTHFKDAAATAAGFNFAYSIIPVFVLEILTALILQIVILGSLGNKGNEALAGVSIGLVVAALIFLSGAIDGAGINPIRSLGPAVFAQNSFGLTQAIIISIANIIGAVIGSFGFKWLAVPEKA